MSPFLHAVSVELAHARQDHPPIHSAHEGYAVLLEELDEFKAEVWEKAAHRSDIRMRGELVQIAAMAARIAEDLGLSRPEEVAS